MQIEQRDGSFDLVKLQATTQAMLEQAATQSSIANPISSYRAGAPNLRVDIDRSKAETLKVSVGDVFQTLSAYLGSTYVNRFNKFGLSLQVYVQADSQYRAHPEDVLKLYVQEHGEQDGADRRARHAPAGGRLRRSSACTTSIRRRRSSVRRRRASRPARRWI